MKEILLYIQRIEALAQAGLSFSDDFYDIERYNEIKLLTNQILGELSIEDLSKTKRLEVNTEYGYPTPKLDVRAIVINNEGKILLVQDSHSKKWSLPGGFCDIGFSLIENLQKEVSEETGLTVEKSRLLAIIDTNRHNSDNLPQQYYKFFFYCNVKKGSIKTSYETSQVEYFDINYLPDLSLKRNTKEQITDFYHEILSTQETQKLLID